jgi:hypothetical protein
MKQERENSVSEADPIILLLHEGDGILHSANPLTTPVRPPEPASMRLPTDLQ